MTLRITNPEFNFRSKLKELDFASVPYEKMPEGSVIQTVSFVDTETTVSSASPTPIISGTVYTKCDGSRLYVSACADANSDTSGAWKWVAIYLNGVEMGPKIITSCAATGAQDALAIVGLSNTLQRGEHLVEVRAWNGNGTTTFGESDTNITMVVMEVKS